MVEDRRLLTGVIGVFKFCCLLQVSTTNAWRYYKSHIDFILLASDGSWSLRSSIVPVVSC